MTLLRPERVLVVAAHPDDEVLGCGGTLAKWARAGAAVQVACVADGVASRGPADAQELRARRESAKRACEVLGLAQPVFGDVPDNQADTVPLLAIAQHVEALVGRWRPDTVLTHHHGDLNVDHRRIHQAVLTACRPQRGHPVRTLLCFEVPSSTEWQAPVPADAFLPSWFEDIADTLALKLEALRCYGAELRPWPHPRSERGVDALARWRGATVGCEAAEAFMLARRVQ